MFWASRAEGAKNCMAKNSAICQREALSRNGFT